MVKVFGNERLSIGGLCNTNSIKKNSSGDIIINMSRKNCRDGSSEVQETLNNYIKNDDFTFLERNTTPGATLKISGSNGDYATIR